jgi:hypothetical protein
VASVLPMKSQQNQNQDLPIKPTSDCAEEMQVLNWVLEKIKTIQDETEQRLFIALNNAAQEKSGKFHPDIPADFDSIAYLLLNRDVYRAGFDPVQHFIIHGKREGRAYKFLNRQTLG